MITTTVQHALRALGDLAGLPAGEARGGSELAARAQVPASYLRKILLALGRAGIVAATRGVNGGYRLARPAGELRLAEVVEALEPDALAAVCFLNGSRPCSQVRACAVHARWRAVREDFERLLRDTTLDDLAREGVALEGWPAGPSRRAGVASGVSRAPARGAGRTRARRASRVRRAEPTEA
jgi:Rrf2 family transcriptional regulator, iron-sulfur cluster assembly transcription factor